MSGHTHRIGEHQRSDHNGVHAWWELGCMCDLNPSYVDDPNWQQGFAVATWDVAGGLYGVEQVRIHSGKGFFRGKLFG